MKKYKIGFLGMGNILPNILKHLKRIKTFQYLGHMIKKKLT